MFRRSFITNLLALINIPFVTKMSRGRESYEPIELNEEEAKELDNILATGKAKAKIPITPLPPHVRPIGTTTKWMMRQHIYLGVEQTPDEMERNLGRSTIIKNRHGKSNIVEYVYYDPQNLKIFKISEEEYKIRLSMPLAKFDPDVSGKILNIDEIIECGRCWVNQENAISVPNTGYLVFWGVAKLAKSYPYPNTLSLLPDNDEDFCIMQDRAYII